MPTLDFNSHHKNDIYVVKITPVDRSTKVGEGVKGSVSRLFCEQ